MNSSTPQTLPESDKPSAKLLFSTFLVLVAFIGFPVFTLFFNHTNRAMRSAQNDQYPTIEQRLGLIDTTESTANGGFVPSITTPHSRQTEPKSKPPVLTTHSPKPHPKPKPTSTAPRPSPRPKPPPTHPAPRPTDPGSGNDNRNNKSNHPGDQPGNVNNNGHSEPSRPGDGKGDKSSQNAGDFNHFNPCSFSAEELLNYGLPDLPLRLRIPASWPDYPYQVDFVESGCAYESNDHRWLLGIQKLTNVFGRPDNFYQMRYWENATTVQVKSHEGHLQEFELGDGMGGYGRNHPDGTTMCLIDIAPGVEYFLTDDTGKTSYSVLCSTLRRFVDNLYT